jgi:xanthosine phosphorylase
MTNQSSAHLAAQTIQTLRPGFKPRLAIVLGSGLGKFADSLENQTIISYDQLPGFPKVSVKGHQGNLILGTLAGVELICLQGRSHYYEGLGFDAVKTYVRAMKLLGCDYFIATNASGSLQKSVGPGELMLITDHINLQPHNPLIGPNDEEFGPRFPPVDHAYNQPMRDTLLTLAHQEKINLHQGVYMAVSGPSYESAAEIRAFRTLGADAVGMSTVPEVLVANHCGLRTAVIAIITNYATGLSASAHNHDSVVAMASSAAEKLIILLQQFVTRLDDINHSA